MIFSAAAAELDRIAEVYESADRALHSAAAMSDEYLSHLSAAEARQWDSTAGRAYGLMLGVLRGEGSAVGEQTGSLGGEARIIAQDLRGAADQARQMAAALSAIAGMDFAGVAGETMARRALAAVDDARSLVSFLSDYGGVPEGLPAVVEGIREAVTAGGDR